MMAALVGVGGAFLLALLGGFWHLGSKLGKIEACIKNLPTNKDVEDKIVGHQDRCPAYRAETSGVSTIPPA